MRFEPALAAILALFKLLEKLYERELVFDAGIVHIVAYSHSHSVAFLTVQLLQFQVGSDLRVCRDHICEFEVISETVGPKERPYYQDDVQDEDASSASHSKHHNSDLSVDKFLCEG